MKNYKQKPKSIDKLDAAKKDLAVSKYMATKLICFKPDSNIFQAVDALIENNISGGPVLDSNNQVVGMIDDKDCLKVLVDRVYHNQPVRKFKVEDYMDDVFKTISLDSNIIEVANIFLTSTYKRLLILDHDGNLVGQVSRSDILKAIQVFNKP
jgi:predicted transcriptional regulator